MIEKYALPEMSNIFSDENRYQLMMDVAVTACEAMADIGQIPVEAYQEIKAKAAYDIQRIAEIEVETRHNAVAFLTCLREKIGPVGNYLHLGMASSDMVDTTTSLQVSQAAELLQAKLSQLRSVLARLAREYKYTLMMGRTHGTYEEPVTFGLKMALWTKEIDRSITRLANARHMMAVGKISGVVGTFASIDPHVETFVCRRLGLHPALVTNQIIQRDRHAEFITTIAIIGSSLDKFATEIRNLSRTEIHEVEEVMTEGQAGSTAIPFKLRPFSSELICGLARMLRGFVVPALEDQVIWHERDTAHSSVERFIIPSCCMLLDYMLYLFTNVMDNLKVFPDNMRRNIEVSRGVVFSQRLLLAMVAKGVMRDQANEIISADAKLAWEQQSDFQYLVLLNPKINSVLSREEIMDIFTFDVFRHNIDYIFERAGL
ncbi:MAG: adenylosuccinate lyase [Clostridia bacterium]|nr:adenylosuccinate lyase [Clostridia bacterium]